MRRLVLLPALALAAWLAPAAARAQCTLTTAPAIAFGGYSPASATPLDSTGTFQFECPNASFRAVASLSAGAGSFAQRQMVRGTDRLDYNLFTTAARTSIWGDGTPPSQTVGNLKRRTRYTIYGRIPAGQWVAPGLYTDTITLTLNF